MIDKINLLSQKGVSLIHDNNRLKFGLDLNSLLAQNEESYTDIIHHPDLGQEVIAYIIRFLGL